MKTDLYVNQLKHDRGLPIKRLSDLRVVAIGGGTGPVVLRALKTRLFSENHADFDSKEIRRDLQQ